MTTRWFFDATMAEHTEQIIAALGSAGLMTTEEPGRTVINHIEPLHQPGPRLTRLRRTASPPTLHGLRQAYLDARSGAAAFTALTGFLAALDAAEFETELDPLDEDPPARVDPAARVGALVCVVLGLLSWYGLISAAVMGSLVVLWVVGVPAAAASWVLGRVVTARRHRDG